MVGAWGLQEAQRRCKVGGGGAQGRGRMVGMERDGGEAKGNSRLETERACQFKSHGVEGIRVFSPLPRGFGDPADPPPTTSAFLGRDSQGLRTQLVGMVKRAVRLNGLGALSSHWRR